MAALTANRDGKRKDGEVQLHPMAASTTVFAGALLMVLAAGLAVPGADTAAGLFIGVAEERKTSAATGTTSVKVRKRGSFECVAAGATQAWVGSTVYLVDDQTVALAITTVNDVACGTVVEFISATLVRVRIDKHSN